MEKNMSNFFVKTIIKPSTPLAIFSQKKFYFEKSVMDENEGKLIKYVTLDKISQDWPNLAKS